VTPYAQHAIATRVRCEPPHGQVARQWLSPQGILAFLPLEGAQGNSVAVVWSVPEDRVSGLMALAADAFAQELQTASQHTLGNVQLIAERATWPLQLAKADRWCGATSPEMLHEAGCSRAMPPTTCTRWQGKG